MFSTKKKIKTISDISPNPVMFTYHSVRDAQARLQNVFIRINGEACLIETIIDGDNPLVHYYPVGMRSSGSRKLMGISLKDLPKVGSLNNLTLGYINFPFDAYYLRRIPAQTTKQGVAINHIQGWQEGGFSWNEKPDFKGMFDNIYPSFEQAKEELLKNEEEIQGRAFHKHFKLKNLEDMDEIILEYKGNKVGLLTDNKKAIRLSPKMSWLRETLEEEMIPYV